jgi:hypothetical protein
LANGNSQAVRGILAHGKQCIVVAQKTGCGRLWARTPGIGEHNGEVYGELSYDQSELRELQSDGVI